MLKEVGDDVIRLGEHLYEIQGFWPDVGDRPSPVWIRDQLAAEHSGDCVKEPWACMRCHAEEQVGVATELLKRMRDEAALGQPPLTQAAEAFWNEATKEHERKHAERNG